MKVPSVVHASVALLALFCVAAEAAAQIPDLAEASAQYMPPVELEEPAPVKAQVSSYDVSLNLPLPLGERSFLIPGLAYHVDSVSYSSTPPDFTELRAFHSLELPLLFVQLLPNDWSLALRVAPGAAGDFHGFDGGLFRVSALALASHSFSERFVLGGGALATYAFGSFLVLPAVYADWKPFDGFRVEGFVPAFVTAKYTVATRVELGLRADIAGNSYAVRDERVAGAWPCVAESADDPATPANETVADRTRCLDHVAFSLGVAGVVMGVRVVESVWLSGFAGRSFFRRLELRDDRDELLPAGEQRLPNDFFVRAGVAWRIPER